MFTLQEIPRTNIFLGFHCVHNSGKFAAVMFVSSTRLVRSMTFAAASKEAKDENFHLEETTASTPYA